MGHKGQSRGKFSDFWSKPKKKVFWDAIRKKFTKSKNFFSSDQKL